MMQRNLIGAFLLAACLATLAWVLWGPMHTLKWEPEFRFEEQAPAIPGISKMYVIGNSITRHPIVPGVWAHESGMSASDKSRDYVHLVGADLSLPVEAVNYPHFEIDPAIGLPHLADVAAPIDGETLVLIELGDNVPVHGVDAFEDAYPKLLAEAKRAGRLVCVSTWWHVRSVDEIIHRSCNHAGGRYAFIGDIFPRSDYPDRRNVEYGREGVDRHPHDYGMARIAMRVVSAAR